MDEEKKRKRPLDLHWDKLLPSRDDEPPLALEITTATTTMGAEAEQLQSAMGGEQQTEGEDFQRMTDSELNDLIDRQRKNFETMGHRLPDKGEKLKVRLKRLEDEKERRKDRRMEMDDDGCEKPTQSVNPGFIGATSGFRQGAPSSPRESQFASRFRKLEENKDSRTVNAFEQELSSLNPCDRRRMRLNGQFSPRGRHKSGLSSRQTPFQCPSILSVDVDKQILSNGDKKGRHSSPCSPCHFEEDLSGCFSKRNACQVQPSNNLRPRNGHTVVLVDEEEPQLIEKIQEAEKVDECLKDTTIYYPSRDDLESVEICYSDLKCLEPEAYLSSTVMNFYIRYLQQPTSHMDTLRCNYHFFNTYFYKKLKEAVLNKRSAKETLFIKFRRWWKGVNVFEKAYILLPIHENLHWSLVIICIPDKEDESGPIILHLDSLGIHCSKSIFDNVKSFLIEEWRYLENQEEAPLDLPIADKIWQNLPRRIDEKKIAVPQQRNEYDCGLFVLFFMERFIEEAPERLKKKDLAMFGKKWFQPEEASSLRRKIHRLLLNEFGNAILKRT